MDIADAILILQPKAEFVIYGNDYSTLQWHSDGIRCPSLADVRAVIDNYAPPPSTDDQIRALQAQVAALLAAQGK